MLSPASLAHNCIENILWLYQECLLKHTYLHYDSLLPVSFCRQTFLFFYFLSLCIFIMCFSELWHHILRLVGINGLEGDAASILKIVH
jgi:hypothetical protein